ncbi:MAG: oxidoreductase domain protein [Acidimicrobiales bacterium]|nr:oxidoreductase domain protein [Acidimicrobiales bacterium]
MTIVSPQPTPTISAWPSPPTGIAVIGCGYWGANYVRLFNELADSRVLAVCDEQPEQLAAVVRHLPDVIATTDVDEVLQVPGVDAVIVVTTATRHYDVARRALEAGKHVLVEKPLTTDTASAEALVAISTEHDLVLLVGHTFLYNAGVRAVKERIKRDDVYYLYAQRTSLGPIRHDVNAAWDLAPHDVSIFGYLLDAQAEWASAVGGRLLSKDREDVVFITLGFPGGVLGHIHVSWADPNKVRQVVVVSSEQRIVFNDLDPLERVRIFEKGVKRVPIADVDPIERAFGDHQLLLRDGDIISPAIRASEPLRNQCGEFLHCVRRGGRPSSDGARGVSVVRTMEAVDRSLALGGAPVQVAGGTTT